MDGDIKGGGGLIADDELGVEREGAGDADALTLAAGEFVGVAVGCESRHAAAFEEFFDLLAEFILVGDEVVDFEGLSDDGGDAHAGIE